MSVHLIPTHQAMEPDNIGRLERDTGRVLKATGELVQPETVDVYYPSISMKNMAKAQGQYSENLKEMIYGLSLKYLPEVTE